MARAEASPDVVTKKKYATDRLREMIVSGDLGAGTRLRQQDVAEMLSVSATPVREAFLQLETEGYLETVPHVGIYVAELTEDHRDEVTDLRILLEAQLSRRAALSITDSQVAHLRSVHQAFIDAVKRLDSRETRRANYQLHRSIWQAADRVVTQQIVEGLWARVPWQNLDNTERGDQSAAEHEILIEALANRDPEGAARATIAHIESARTYLAPTGGAS